MADSPWSLFSPFAQTFGRFYNSPDTNWSHFFNPQVIFNANPGDQAIESHVLSKVGSYGSQISTLIDAIAVLSTTLDRTKLDPEQATAMASFDKLEADAQKAVDEYRAAITPDDIVAAATALHKSDKTAAAALLGRLETALKA